MFVQYSTLNINAIHLFPTSYIEDEKEKIREKARRMSIIICKTSV